MIAAKVSQRSMASTVQHAFWMARGALGQTMITAVVIQLGLFMTGPLVARMLGVEDRGHLAALTLWPATIATIAIWGLPTALTYERAAHGSLPPALIRGVSLVTVAQALATVIVHVVVLTAWMPDAWGAMQMAALVSLLLGPAFIAKDYGLAVLQGARNFRWFNSARLSHLIVYLPLVMLLFVAEWGNLTRIVAASVVASLAFAGVAIAAAGRQERQAASAGPETSLRTLLSFGQQAHFGRLMPVERFRADQLAVAVFLTPSALGLYAVANAFTNVMRFLTQAIGYVAFPTVASESETERARRLMWRYVRVAILISVLIVTILEVVGPWLISLLFGEEFRRAGPALRLLLPGVGFVSVRRVLAESLRGVGHPTATSIAEAVTGIAFIVLIYPLLTIWDLEGVATTVTVAEGLGLAVLVGAMMRTERHRGEPLNGAHG